MTDTDAKVPETAADLLDPATCALVMWELRPGTADRAPDLERLARVWRGLMSSAHQHGVLTVLSRHVELRPELMNNVQRWRSALRNQAGVHSTSGDPASEASDFLPGFEPAQDQLVIDKTTASLFHDTQADSRLRARGITTVVLAGVATDAGIDFTARHAMAFGYFVVIVEDGCGSYTTERHELGLEVLRPAAFMATSTDVISAWSAAAA